MEWYDLEGQRSRRKLVLQALKEHTLEYFDDQGNWVAPIWVAPIWAPGPPLRERLWFAMAFLQDGEERAVRRANGIIVSSTYTFCHFSPMVALQMLIKFGDRLETAAQTVLTDYLKEVLEQFREPEHDFVGVNDNFPCMATYTALMGGQLFGWRDLYEVGVRRLHQLKALLRRRGVDTEYASPTYTVIHAYVMAEIANYIDDEALRKIALQCEERVWVDLLGHYHPSTYQIAGPYSRAYTVDSTGYTHQARYVYYALLGEQVAINPLNTIFADGYGDDPRNVIHNGLPFMQVSVANLAGADYHCPPALVNALVNKTYPFFFKATTEYGPSTDALAIPRTHELADIGEYAAGSGSISTFMTEDYALGIATNEFHNGAQSDTFHVLYRRREPVVHQADVNTVYARYLINGCQPGQENVYPTFATTSGDNFLWDQGRKIGLHHERTAMLLYKPKQYGRNSVESLELAIILPAYNGVPEEIWLGDHKLDGPNGSSQQPCSVFVKDGPIYLAFHPLLLTDHGREVAVRVRLVNNFVLISFYNYQGPTRDFSIEDFLLTGNGFVTEVASEREVGSFAAFRAKMQQVSVHDELFTCVHYRWANLRRTIYERDGLELACEYSPITEGIKYQTVNGRVPATPQLEVTGIDTCALPFLEH
jgi:hypothetical protein